MPSAIINIAAATTTAVIPAPAEANAKLRILSISMVAAAAINPVIKDGSTALTGAIPLTTAQDTYNPDPPSGLDGLWTLTAGNAFNITTDTNAQLSGTVQFTTVGQSASDKGAGGNQAAPSTKGTPYGIPSGILHSF